LGSTSDVDPLIFQPDKDNKEFDLDDAEVKLHSLMKTPYTVDGCKLINTVLIKLQPVKGRGVGGVLFF
jgi:hypothetical protein